MRWSGFRGVVTNFTQHLSSGRLEAYCSGEPAPLVPFDGERGKRGVVFFIGSEERVAYTVRVVLFSYSLAFFFLFHLLKAPGNEAARASLSTTGMVFLMLCKLSGAFKSRRVGRKCRRQF